MKLETSVEGYDDIKIALRELDKVFVRSPLPIEVLDGPYLMAIQKLCNAGIDALVD